MVDGVLVEQFGMKVEVGHFADRRFLEDQPMDEIQVFKKDLYSMLLKKM